MADDLMKFVKQAQVMIKKNPKVVKAVTRHAKHVAKVFKEKKNRDPGASCFANLLSACFSSPPPEPTVPANGTVPAPGAVPGAPAQAGYGAGAPGPVPSAAPGAYPQIPAENGAVPPANFAQAAATAPSAPAAGYGYGSAPAASSGWEEPPAMGAPPAISLNPAGTDPTAQELADLSLVGQKLWELDDNRLTTGSDYTIDAGYGKRAYDQGDAAPGKLFVNVSKALWQKGTYRLLYALRDNYNTTTGHSESETQQENQEITAFLDAIMNTRPMEYVRKYLSSKRLAPADAIEFKKMLYQMWFSFYRREAQNDSCGFEHVFLGESDKGEISGFHNWMQFWIEEAKGHLDYSGYLMPRGHNKVDANDRVLSCQFLWNGQTKSVTTLFIGTSPEFEFALYTLYFLAGQERNNISINGYDLCIRCYAIRSQYGNKIGSAFPELMGESTETH